MSVCSHSKTQRQQKQGFGFWVEKQSQVCDLRKKIKIILSVIAFCGLRTREIRLKDRKELECQGSSWKEALSVTIPAQVRPSPCGKGRLERYKTTNGCVSFRLTITFKRHHWHHTAPSVLSFNQGCRVGKAAHTRTMQQRPYNSRHSLKCLYLLHKGTCKVTRDEAECTWTTSDQGMIWGLVSIYILSILNLSGVQD